MNRRRVAAVAVLLTLLCASAIGRGQQQPPPQFRANTDVVTLDVLVRSGFGPVGGLKPADLLVVDNGVPQRVDSVENSTMPVDVSVLIDLSGWTMGAWQNEPRDSVSEADPFGKLGQIRALLRPDDRVRLLTIDDAVTEVLPMQQATASVVEAPLKGDGLAALNDALVAAMLRPVEPNRRHFVFAFTKGLDTRSVVDLSAVSEIARRSDAIVHIVEDIMPLMKEQELQVCQCVNASICQPTMRFFLPVRRGPMGVCGGLYNDGPRDGRHREELGAAAATTGGGYHISSVLQIPDLLRTFKETIDAFRQGYVVRYTPQGVKREGWHDITVTVANHPSYSVQARRGYWVESATAAAPSVSARSAPSMPAAAARGSAPATVESLADAYERGDYPGVLASLAASPDLGRLVRSVREGNTRWPSAPRRDAVFALEVASAALRSDAPGVAEEGQKLLVQYTTLIRPALGPDEFECAWYWTAATALQGAIRPAIALPFVKRALERCPDHPRLQLGLAIVTDQQWPTGVQQAAPNTAFPIRPPTPVVRDLPALYDAAMAFPETALEARARSAWLAYRVENYTRAETLLSGPNMPGGDRVARYLAEVVRGKTLTALKRPLEAEAAFRSALVIVPGAQSARVALMSLLLSRGERTEAEELARAVTTAADDLVDPWWAYWQGDNRAFGAILGRLREMAQ